MDGKVVHTVHDITANGPMDLSCLRYKATKDQKGEDMSLASGHHRIMVAAQGALVMMVLGKVTEVCSRPHIPRCYSRVGSSKLTIVEGWWWSCLYERRRKKFGGLLEILSTRLGHVT
jgi:hypothetical protein